MLKISKYWTDSRFWVLICLHWYSFQMLKSITFFIYVCINIFWLCKNICLRKTFCLQKLSCLWKASFIKYILCAKFSWLWKIFMTVKKSHVFGKFSWLWKVFLTVEKFPWLRKRSLALKMCFLDCKKNNRHNDFENNC